MSEPEAPTSLAASLALSAVSTFLVLLLLGGLEGVLRLTGIGDRDASRARLKYQQIYLPVLEEAVRADGTPSLRTADRRLPYQSILRDRSAHSLRVLVFGGSAAAGLGYSPNVTFARYLERLLKQAQPDDEVEVLNLGIVALSSRQVKLLVADTSQRYRPDVVVIYSGNNEFLEIHAEKYAAAHATLVTRVVRWFSDTNLFRLLDQTLGGRARAPSAREQELSNEDLRLTQRRIVEDIQMTPDEVVAVIDEYEANIEQAVAAAQQAGSAVVLMEVGSNWKWRGREDLPQGWQEELLGPGAPVEARAWRSVYEVLTEKLETAAPKERSELLFKRAVAAEAQGDFDAARRDYRAAMNEDPHLRRALDAMNERLARVAQRRDVPLLGTVRVLWAQSASHQIVGFESYYDYVHFTPRGAIAVAAALVVELQRVGLVPMDFDALPFVSQQSAWLKSPREDPLAVEEWLGFSGDPERIHDRDLWKYETMVKALDAHIEENPEDVRALVYRGNARSFELDGAAAAARDYQAALLLSPGQPEIQHNLERLEREGRLDRSQEGGQP